MAAPTYNIGQAPWETGSTAKAQTFDVGQAPWEVQAPTAMATPEPVARKNDLLDNPVTRAIQAIFPGKKVGQAIGTLAGAGIAKLQGNYQNYDISAPSPLQVAGDVAQGALTVAAPGVGRGSTVLGRIGANTALGGGIGTTGAIAEGKGAKDVLKEGTMGALTGGVLSAATEGVGALVNNLPKWITKSVLPKLKDQNVDYALKNTKLGTAKTMLKSSEDSIKNYESRVQAVLTHPEFANVAEDVTPILDDALSIFPNSEYAAADLIKNAKEIAPKVSKLITKMEAGQANLQELNAIRKELDSATKSVYTSLNRPPETKALGAALSNALRDYVKTTAPETADIFLNYAKEVDLQKALQALNKKTGDSPISFKDVLAGASGYAHSGFKGALSLILIERGLLSPAGRMVGAKALNAVGQSAPLVSEAIRGTKAPLIKSASTLQMP
jgi:hypothetical protein